MNIKLLKAFVTLAEKGNYAQAALALSMTQPALTKQINLLESQVNIPLFSRGRHGSQLTTGGRRLLPEVIKVLKQMDNMLRYAEQIVQGSEGRIAMGFGLSSFYFAPESIAKFRNTYPAIDITLEDIPSSKQYELLESGELQIGFVRVPAKPPLQHHTLFEDRLVMVVPENNGLTVENWLKRLPLLRLHTERGRGLNTQTDIFLQSSQFFPSSIQKAGDIQTLLALVSAGIGVAILPQSILHIAPATVHRLPLTGDSVSWNVGIAWNACIPDKVRDNFIDMVVNENQLITNR
ncbi:LysR family transcriptional regulator [Ewingella americana]|uniref:LysR family transcriptional regulator n=1 Tax=Ewingella americana TaxID=41202 RepID=A0A502GBP4_9GAMM|nr:LysR family transcriptional regulator [Ewingella americana]TPG59264.1 LysR family transcriptional regulator [Ewingella americana]